MTVSREDSFTWFFSRDVDTWAGDRKGLGTLDSVCPAWSSVGETCHSQSGSGTTVNTHKPLKPEVSDSNSQMDSSQVVFFITSCTITIDTNVLPPLTILLNSPLLRVTIANALAMHRCTRLPQTPGTKMETSDRGPPSWSISISCGVQLQHNTDMDAHASAVFNHT